MEISFNQLCSLPVPFIFAFVHCLHKTIRNFIRLEQNYLCHYSKLVIILNNKQFIIYCLSHYDTAVSERGTESISFNLLLIFRDKPEGRKTVLAKVTSSTSILIEVETCVLLSSFMIRYSNPYQILY